MRTRDARKAPGLTGEALVENLETRLDALVLRSGFARTILPGPPGRRAPPHALDGKIVDQSLLPREAGPDLQVKPKEPATVRSRSPPPVPHRDVLRDVPGYLDVQLEKLSFRPGASPKRAEIPVTCEVQLVVEYYAR